jgi:hypothetical protein
VSIWAALYGTRPEVDQADPKIIDVIMCKLRARLKPYGIHIGTMWGRGFIIDEINHKKLATLSTMEPGFSPERFSQLTAA